MRMSKFAKTTLFSMVLTLALAGVASADSSADVTNTGPNSTNQVTIDNSNHLDVSNDNQVAVTNTNNQTATTGSAEVKDNTNAGSAASGGATNQNTTATTINVTAPAETFNGGAGGGAGQGGGGSTGLGGPSNGGSGAGSTGVGSGSTSMGAGVLPATGPSQPIDVSALRNLLSKGSDPVVKATQANPITSKLLMVAALVMSLIGAAGAAAYSNKRTLKV